MTKIEEQIEKTVEAVKNAIVEMRILKMRLIDHEDLLSAREILEGLEDDLENLIWLDVNHHEEDLYISEI